MKYPALSIGLLFSVLMVSTSTPAFAQDEADKAGIFYGIKTVGDTYQVIAKATHTPAADISLSGQVTLKVPHAGSEAERFEAAEVSSPVEGIQWIESSRVDAPKEDPAADYVSFAFVDAADTPDAFHWQAGEEKVLFSFRNPNPCLGEVQLLADDDAFNQMPNSMNTNPGNQFTNLGWGSVSDNHYLGNLPGSSATCPGSK